MFRYTILIYFILTFPYILCAQEARITIIDKNVSLIDVFKEIENQTGYNIAFNQTKFDPLRTISLQIKDTELKNALPIILKESRYTYKLSGNHIILIPEEKLVQTLYGIVKDEITRNPLPFAFIGILGNNEMETLSDTLGQFKLASVPLGRHDIIVTCMGYDTFVYRDVIIGTGRKPYLELLIKEKINELEEITIYPSEKISLDLLSGRYIFDIEKSNMAAGIIDDPVRMLSSYAGVSSKMGNNGIAIHGNSPALMLWRVEEMEVTNINHFGELFGIQGGGIFSSIHMSALQNSSFLTGAFPANYNNAISGVFDMKLRNGNSYSYNHTVSLNTSLGIDFMSEGPLNKQRGSSYIINYRYSMAGISSYADSKNQKRRGEKEIVDYQDMSFKLNFPLKNSSISIWGIGLVDKTNINPNIEKKEWKYNSDIISTYLRQYTFSSGAGYNLFFNNKTSLNFRLASNFSKMNIEQHNIIGIDNDSVYSGMQKTNNRNVNLSISLSHKFSSRFINKTGLSLSKVHHDKQVNLLSDNIFIRKAKSGYGRSTSLSFYNRSLIDVNDKIAFDAGISSLYFYFNKKWMLEPRLSINWKAKLSHLFSFSYGLHSKMQNPEIYFQSNKKKEDYKNKHLGMTKAHRINITYNWKINEKLQFNSNLYYEYLFNIPVVADSSYSILNAQDFIFDKLENTGLGKNYGLDLTLDQSFNSGSYYTATVSLFNSQYRGGNKIWYDTSFNRRFIMNLLAGKEWEIGKKRQNLLGVNFKLTYQGGMFYSPVDKERSEQEKKVCYDEEKSFMEQFSPEFIFSCSLNYRINMKKSTHIFSLNLHNITGNKDFLGHEYNWKTGTVDVQYINFSLSNIKYQIQF